MVVLLSHVGMFGIPCSVYISNFVLSVALTLASSLSYQSSVVVRGHLFVVVRHHMLSHCNAVPFVLSSLFVLKVHGLTVVCIISSCKHLFAVWSFFSLPDIPIWVGIQLIVGLGPCANLEVASLMALVIVFKYNFLLFRLFTTVKESVGIVMLSLVSQAFSIARRMAVISVQMRNH